ncbi:MAG: hypothetical protein Q7J03_06065 [Methanoregula sp.]|nr:hypothetical protein [Methanoregula sp.]
MAEQRELALSETMGIILIAMLVILATVILIAALTGVMTKMLGTPALITAKADQFETTDGKHIISLTHLQGDPVILNGTSQTDGVSIISLSLTAPSGGEDRLVSLTAITENSWRPGETLYIYKKTDGPYGFSDIPPPMGEATSLAPGDWTVKILDDKVIVLLHSLPVTIK